MHKHVTKKMDVLPAKSLELNGSRYPRIDQVKYFRGSLPQVLLGSFLNTLIQMIFLLISHLYRLETIEVRVLNLEELKNLFHRGT